MDPIQSHAVHIAKLLEAPIDVAPPAPAANPNPPVESPVDAGVSEASSSAEAGAQAQGGDVGGEVQSPPAVAKPAAPAKNKLERSLEIQRRAEAAARRARAEAGKLKPKAAPKEAEKKATPAAAPKTDNEIASIQAQLQAEIRLAKDNPLEFARRHGVSGAEIAEMVRNDTDPTARALANLRADASQAIAQVRKEAQTKIDALQEQITSGHEVQAQRNFFEFVEDAKDANPDAFKAIGSGVIYSDAEIWNKANELLESRADLRDNFDEDKLLEAIELEAQQDPRWIKLQALLAKTTPAQAKQPNATSTDKPNARPREEVAETSAAPRQPAPRGPNGQFESRTPMERHAKHLQHILNTVRFGG